MTWWGRLLRGQRVEQQLDRELREHVERQVADYIAEGMTESAARRRARLEFGGLDQVKELCRDARGTRLVEETIRDIGYAARVFRKTPGFTAIAVLTLSLGIGANVSIFALIDALLLRPLPVSNAGELIAIWRVPHSESFSLPQVQEFAAQHDLFNSLCAFGMDAINVGPPEAVDPVAAAWVTGNFHETLGIRPIAGRLLRPDDDRIGATPVAVITDAFWLRKFARSPAAVGEPLLVDGVPVTVVGVTPPGFLGAVIGEAADVTLPVSVRPQVQPASDFLGDDSRWLRVLARPRAGLSSDQMEARLAVIWSQRMKATLPATLAADARARRLSSTLRIVSGTTGTSDLRPTFRTPLFVAMALVGLVLLIACVNVANLLLARAAARRREVSLRLAIGAGRGRILRQMLTESALLALVGAAGGLIIGLIGSSALVSLISRSSGPESLGQVVLDLSLDWRIFTFTTVVVVLTTLLFGAAPALRAAKTAPMSPLTTRSVDSRRHVAAVLVTAQVGLSVLVLVGAGLFARTLYNLRTVERGFQHDGVLIAEVDARRAGYEGDALDAFNRELFEFVQQTPGVRVASVASVTPLRGGGISVPMLVNGQPAGDSEVYLNNVGPRYFETLRTGVVAGREFTPEDTTGAPLVAVVNEAFVRAYMRGQPLGQWVSIPNTNIERQVVGVVRDAVYETLRADPPPTVYRPFFQRAGRGGFGDIPVTLVIYAPRALDSVAAAVREYVQPKLGGRPPRIRTLTEQVDGSLSRERLMATVTAIFGALVLMLAAIGIYGLLAYWVAQRTQEIGVRVALGAARVAVLRLVLGDALRMLLLGAAIGIPAAWALSRTVTSLLFGLTPGDLSTLVGAVVVLMTTGAIAAFIPARRATRVNPVTALRYE